MGTRINRRLALALGGLALAGATGGLLDSAAASTTPAPVVIRITNVTEKHRRISVSGQITPAAAVVRTTGAKPFVILNRVQGNAYYQLSDGAIVSPRGKFTIKPSYDEFGRLRRNTYALEFNAAPRSGYTQVIKTFVLRLTK